MKQLTHILLAAFFAAVMSSSAFADDVHMSLFPNTSKEVRILGKTVNFDQDDAGIEFADFDLGPDYPVTIIPKDSFNNSKFLNFMARIEGSRDPVPGLFKRDRQRPIKVNYIVDGDTLKVRVKGVSYIISSRTLIIED